MADYISREAAKQAIQNALNNGGGYGEALNAIPAANVRPVGEISDAVDEALDFLNRVSKLMPYHVYSALFDLIDGICPE